MPSIMASSRIEIRFDRLLFSRSAMARSPSMVIPGRVNDTLSIFLPRLVYLRLCLVGVMLYECANIA